MATQKNEFYDKNLISRSLCSKTSAGGVAAPKILIKECSAAATKKKQGVFSSH
jgi:hypothetical protein